MPQQPEARLLCHLTEVPAGWRLATVIDAFAHLAGLYFYNPKPDRAREALSRRLVDLWAAQPAEAQAWLSRCQERFATELAGEATRTELLCEALRRHGAAEDYKYGCDKWRFSEAGLLRGEPWGSAAEGECAVAWHLEQPHFYDRCWELAERLRLAESRKTAGKRQKREDETAERQRLEAELHTSQEEGRELRNRLAAAEAQLHSAKVETAKHKEHCAPRATSAESAAEKMRQELGQLQDEHGKCQERCQELASRLEAAEAAVSKQKGRLAQEERQGCQACMALAKEEAEKAVLQEQCEQLRQQLKETSAKAEAERSAMLGRMQVLREELKDMHKHRIRELELQQREARDLVGHANAETSHGQAAGLAEQLGCFMPDAIFKVQSCDAEYYLMSKDLKKGSHVASADGKAVLASKWPRLQRSVPPRKWLLASRWCDAACDPGPSRASPRRKGRARQDSLPPRGPAEGGRLGGARFGKRCKADRGESPGYEVRGAEDRL